MDFEIFKGPFIAKKVCSKACIKRFFKVIQSLFYKLTNFYYNHYFAKHKLDLVLRFLED